MAHEIKHKEFLQQLGEGFRKLYRLILPVKLTNYIETLSFHGRVFYQHTTFTSQISEVTFSFFMMIAWIIAKAKKRQESETILNAHNCVAENT